MNNESKDMKLQKFGAFYMEIQTGLGLIVSGFSTIQNITSTKLNSFNEIQLLSQGFEKLLKVQICLSVFIKTGKYPSSQDLKNKYGHDLKSLKNEMVNNHFTLLPHLIKDLLFIKSDIKLDKLISILSNFGKQGRYFNLNVISDANNNESDPMSQWDRFKLDIIIESAHLSQKLKEGIFFEEENKLVNKEIVGTLEQFVWVISRQFIWGLGDLGKRLSPLFIEFYTKDPDTFGETDYSLILNPKPKVYEKVAPNKVLKSRLFRITEFKEWPFIENEVIVEKWDDLSYVVCINNIHYALNGIAISKHGLENVYKAGMAIKGKSIGGFSAIAENL